MSITEAETIQNKKYVTVPITPKKTKKQKPAKQTNANDEPSSYRVLGQSLSTCFLSTVNASQTDLSTAMRNLGRRPMTGDSCSPISSDFSSSCSTLGCIDEEPATPQPAIRTRKSRAKFQGSSYTLRDFSAFETIETLLLQYGTASHMGVRDPSYTFFINDARTGALYYKLLDKVAVITGDPLCSPTRYEALLEEFRAFCKAHDWSVAIMAAGSDLAALAKDKKWITMRFGVEKSINPIANSLLLGKGGKRTVTKCKQLLKTGINVQLYCPSYQHDPDLEVELKRLYDDWRETRNTEREVQAFMTVFDILALPRLVTFLYARDPLTGSIIGFAALRKLANNGFHIDPLVASEDAPKGTTDLLLFSAMAFCNTAGISKLSLGFEPKQELSEEDISGMSSFMSKATRKVHKKMWSDLPLGGKKAFHERWHTDEELDEDLYIVFLGTPALRHMLAMVHFANISLRSMIASHMKKEKEKETE